MTYDRHFTLADEYIVYLDQTIGAIQDGFIKGRYLGFVVVSSVTVYETAIKEILFHFAQKKHAVFGAFVENQFSRLNARIRLDDLKKEYVAKFGTKYLERFTKHLNEVDDASIKNKTGSVKQAYANLINWRHNFVHTGEAPSTTNYDEIKNSYALGKEVIHCLSRSLTR